MLPQSPLCESASEPKVPTRLPTPAARKSRQARTTPTIT